MKTNFECKVKYTKIDYRYGKEKKVTESYLVNAVSFSDAEEIIFKQLEKFISGEFVIVSIKRVNFSDIVTDMGEMFYSCKISFMSIDENAGKEKK